MDSEDSVVVRVWRTQVNEQPCGCEVVGGGETDFHCVVEDNLLVLLQDGSGESEFVSEGEAIVGGLCLGIYCRYCITHLVYVLVHGSSQHSLKQLRLQFMHSRVPRQRHGEVLFLVFNLD